MKGPGKYGAECEAMLRDTGAVACILIVIEGDRGTGFDLDDVPADRLGVRQSILGRMERHGGSARVRRRDDGTEVELRLPPLQGDQP